MNVLFKIEGAEELRRALKRSEKAFLAEMAEALPLEGEALRAQANADAPTLTGELVRSSCVSSEVQEQKGTVEVAVAYLDEKAAAVHEGVHGGRDVDGTTRGEKWFERAMYAFERGFVARIGARLKRLVGGGA